MATTDNPYDLVPYDSVPIFATRPDQLALTSAIHGGPRPPVERIRVLEIGCSNGANLLPLAYYQPDGAFAGIDSSSIAINEANTCKGTLGLENVSFFRVDLADELPGELRGPFDYVLAHGIFSWVPSDARARLLRLCKSVLAPHGLAYISYNVNPAWKIRGTVRDVLRAATATAEAPRERIEEARELAGTFRDILGEDPIHPYQKLLARELGRIVDGQPHYILHEYLSAVNDPFYFSAFLELIAQHQLSYVADAMFHQPEGRMPAPLVEKLAADGYAGQDLEQIVDIIGYRQFRHSVLCHHDAERPEKLSTEEVKDLYVAGELTPTSKEPRLDPNIEETFRSTRGAEVTTDGPAPKALFFLLGERRPRGVAVPLLMQEVGEKLQVLKVKEATIQAAAVELSGELVSAHSEGYLQLRLREPNLPRDFLLQPHTLARFEAARRSWVTTPYHGGYRLNEFEARLVELMDGKRERSALVDAMVELVVGGQLTLEVNDSPVTNAGEAEPVVSDLVTNTLRDLAQWGLLAAAD